MDREPLTMNVRVPEGTEDGELQLMGVLDNACRNFQAQGGRSLSAGEIHRAVQWLATKWESPF